MISLNQIVKPRLLAMASAAGTLVRPRHEAGASIRRGIGTKRKQPNLPNRLTGKLSVCVIIPAHNEQSRITAVIRPVLESGVAQRVIVVNDGSTDRTLDVVREFEPEIELIDLKQNKGKGGAMLAGAAAAEGCDILLFLDGDLQNLTPAHVSSLVRPLVNGQSDMAIGQFRGGRGLTDLAQLLVPNISGQRAIKRDLFLAIPGLDEVGYGIEMAITLNVRRMKGRVCSVTIRGVTHPMKEEKLGLTRGALSRFKMYAQMLRFTLKYLTTNH